MLRTTVLGVKVFLHDAEERQAGGDDQVKEWIGELKEVLYDADDLLDDFSTEALRRQVMTGNKVAKEGKCLLKCLRGLKTYFLWKKFWEIFAAQKSLSFLIQLVFVFACLTHYVSELGPFEVHGARGLGYHFGY